MFTLRAVPPAQEGHKAKAMKRPMKPGGAISNTNATTEQGGWTNTKRRRQSKDIRKSTSFASATRKQISSTITKGRPQTKADPEGDGGRDTYKESSQEDEQHDISGPTAATEKQPVLSIMEKR